MTIVSKKAEKVGRIHEKVYKSLRNQIMFGELIPGQSLTLRGIGKKFGVSMTPSREAVQRLVAEGALSISSSGRIITPEPDGERIEELSALRSLLEVELACRALPRVHHALIERLKAINGMVGTAVSEYDSVSYIRTNLDFHRTLYLRAQAPAMLAMVETVWLQLGPTMRSLYNKIRKKEPPYFHKLILTALEAGDEPSLRLAIRSDVTQGLRMLVN